MLDLLFPKPNSSLGINIPEIHFFRIEQFYLTNFHYDNTQFKFGFMFEIDLPRLNYLAYFENIYFLSLELVSVKCLAIC